MLDTTQPPPTAVRIRVLFVDDEANVLDGLRRALHSMRAVWDMTFASSPAAALEMMAQSAPDVVVSDMRMPRMNGAELLGEVKRLYPQAVRFILSGYADSKSVMQVAGTAHQYLSKPCDSDGLKVAIARAVGLRKMLESETLRQRIGDIAALPSLPRVYRDITACLQSADPTIGDVARIINQDVVMTTMVLKLANSAFFGAKQTFKTADRAVSFLGLNTISGLVLAHGIFNDATVAGPASLDLDELWQHSLLTATLCRRLACHEGWTSEQAEEAFLAGVLHDVGRLVLAIRAVQAADGTPSEDPHAAVGAYLLGLWGFSDTLIEAIAFHHAPGNAAGGFGLAGLLHVADRIARDSVPDAGYLESLGLTERLVRWQAAAAAADA